MALSRINANSITDDSITVDQIADTAVHGRRNLVINGAMQVAQRGTSVTGVTSGAYRTCDRFMFSPFGPAGTWTVTQSTDAPDGFSNSFRIDCTTADASLGASDFVIVETKIEAQNLQHLMYGDSSAKTVTASFYVKSNKTGTYVLELRQPDSGRLYNKTYTIDAANTWEYKTLTFPGDVSGTINNDNGQGLNMNFWCAAGTDWTSGSIGTSWHTTNANRATGVVNLADSTDNDWSITGVQLEVGDKATPFEHRSFGEELSLCHRYCFAMQGTGDPLGSKGGAAIPGGGRGFWGFGSAHNSANPVTWVQMPTSMRGVPSLTVSDNTHFSFDRGWAALSASTSTQIQTLRSSSKAIAVICNVGSGLSNGDAGSLSANNSAAYMIFDAEL